MSQNYIERAKEWLSPLFDLETREEVEKLLKENSPQLEEAFYKNLQFGTGGLRGIMGVGTNRVNIYTISMATQGFANHLKEKYRDEECQLSVVIAYDSRINSELFAEQVAKIFSGNGFRAYLFKELKPTPLLSYAIRELEAVGGVMVTASHNPKEYNGYKVYGCDGAQVVAPEDREIIEQVIKVEDPSKVVIDKGGEGVVLLDESVEEHYLDSILSLTLNSEVKAKGSPLKILYTPLHGVGVTIVPKALGRAGFRNLSTVKEQESVDGTFDTVISPNPEEREALKLALQQGEEMGVDLILATDPDADRVGVAARDRDGVMRLLNGNEMATLLTYYILEQLHQRGELKEGPEGDYIVKTVVTTDLLTEIANHYQVETFNLLTGFKYIAELVKLFEGKRRFIAGGEESYGFNVGEYVRDKDGVVTSCMVAEVAEWCRERGETLWDLLEEIHLKFALYREELLSVTKEGLEGAKEIENYMKQLRNQPPQSIDGSRVMLIHDYHRGESVDLISDLRYSITLPKSNLLQFITADSTIVSVRPSGTEPKLKFYFGVKSKVDSKEHYSQVENQLKAKLKRVAQQFSW